MMRTSGVVAGFAITLLSTSTVGQTISAGPYYATPSWDQKLQCDTAATCPRFIVLANWNNEAVLDRETGLVWQRTANNGGVTGTSYAGAVQACWTARTGGRQGWHLPRIEEFFSLADPSNAASGPLPAGHPFLNVLYDTFSIPGLGPVSDGTFWSADRNPPDFTLGLQASFQRVPGQPPATGINGASLGVTAGVWCVRAATGAPQR